MNPKGSSAEALALKRGKRDGGGRRIILNLRKECEAMGEEVSLVREMEASEEKEKRHKAAVSAIAEINDFERESVERRREGGQKRIKGERRSHI